VEIAGEHGDELVAEPVDVEIVVLAMAVSSGVDLGVLHRIGTALADRTRRRIIVQLLAGPAYRPSSPTALAPPGRTCPSTSPVSEIAVWSRPPPEGRRICYDLADPRLGDALRLLSSLDLPGTCDT
jgi:hypothetical protein